MGREERRWYQTSAVDGPEELKLVDKTHSGMKAPDHADTCRQAWRFSMQFVGGPEANADHAALMPTKAETGPAETFVESLQ